MDARLGIRYREDQRGLKRVLYTDPTDLFLNGVMDSRQGSCGNMAALHVALGWRLHWQVSLACVGSHLICRYDDGRVTHNIEATNNSKGGFHSHPDEYYLKEHRLTARAVRCGSDLRAVTPRELLGLFIGLRGRYYDNVENVEQAERDYLRARMLFPQNRCLFNGQVQATVQMASRVFDPHEKGHPIELAEWLPQVVFQLRRQEEQSRAYQYSTITYIGDRQG